ELLRHETPLPLAARALVDGRRRHRGGLAGQAVAASGAARQSRPKDFAAANRAADRNSVRAVVPPVAWTEALKENARWAEAPPESRGRMLNPSIAWRCYAFVLVKGKSLHSRCDDDCGKLVLVLLVLALVRCGCSVTTRVRNEGERCGWETEEDRG